MKTTITQDYVVRVTYSGLTLSDFGFCRSCKRVYLTLTRQRNEADTAKVEVCHIFWKIQWETHEERVQQLKHFLVLLGLKLPSFSYQTRHLSQHKLWEANTCTQHRLREIWSRLHFFRKKEMWYYAHSEIFIKYGNVADNLKGWPQSFNEKTPLEGYNITKLRVAA